MAIKNHKNSVAWGYTYDDYDSYTVRWDNLKPGAPDNLFANSKNSPSSAGKANAYGGACDYLYNIVYGHKGGGPTTPLSFDYAYVEKRIEQELRALGCKQVELYIGPKTIVESKPIGKPSILTGKYKYHDVASEVIKWMISVSW